MANNWYRVAVGAILVIIGAGGYLAFAGYSSTVYPIDLARGNMSAIIGSADTDSILSHIAEARAHLPAGGNPVWLFPTADTDFGRIQGELEQMSEYVVQVAAVPQDSSAYNTAMLNVDNQAAELRNNLSDAVPYMYASLMSMLLAVLWISAIIGVFAVLKRKKDQMASVDV